MQKSKLLSATMLSEGLNNIIEKTQLSIFKIEKKNISQNKILK